MVLIIKRREEEGFDLRKGDKNCEKKNGLTAGEIVEEDALCIYAIRNN